MKMILDWQSYAELYAFLQRLSESYSIAFETRATPVRGLVEFELFEKLSDEPVLGKTQLFVFMNLA
jgi:hypothetical protein